MVPNLFNYNINSLKKKFNLEVGGLPYNFNQYMEKILKKKEINDRSPCVPKKYFFKHITTNKVTTFSKEIE